MGKKGGQIESIERTVQKPGEKRDVRYDKVFATADKSFIFFFSKEGEK